jgi:hypothetical protein
MRQFLQLGTSLAACRPGFFARDSRQDRSDIRDRPLQELPRYPDFGGERWRIFR